jgi:hypothetical protein
MIKIKRFALASAAALAIAGGAVAAPAAYASTSAGIAQPSCWSRSARCLTATPAPPPPLKYQPTPPPLKYQPAAPGLKYQDQPGQDQPPIHYHA